MNNDICRDEIMEFRVDKERNTNKDIDAMSVLQQTTPGAMKWSAYQSIQSKVEAVGMEEFNS